MEIAALESERRKLRSKVEMFQRQVCVCVCIHCLVGLVVEKAVISFVKSEFFSCVP